MKKVITTIALLVSITGATEDFTKSLSKGQLVLLDSVARNFSIDDGCRGTISQTRKSFLCPEAAAFYNYAAWFAAENKPGDFIIDKLRQHNNSYFHAQKYTLSSSTIQTAGDPKSPVSIIAYVTADCPHCKKAGIPLHDLVVGPYKGKASFQIKPIHNTLGDYALLAASEQGKAWDLFEAFGNVESRLDEDAILKAAASAKLDVARLKKCVNNKTAIYKKIIDANYKEAKRNDMNFTPTFYFNGYMYQSNKHPMWIMEYIDYILRTKKYLK